MANEYLGRKITVGIAHEGTRGTPEAAPEFWLRILEQKHKDKVEYLKSQGSIGTIVESPHAEIDKQWGEGGFDAEIDADSIGLMLLALYGEVSSENVRGDVYIHTFELAEDANHQSLSIWVNEPGRSNVYPLSCLDSLEFSFERGKILDFSANLMSQKGEVDEQTPAFAPLQAFRPKDFHFYLADDIAGLDSAEEVFLKTCSLNYSKNLEPDDVLGLESPQNFLNKVFSPEASISFLYTDDTYRGFFKAGTPKAMRIKILNESIVLEPAIAASGTFTVVDYTALSGKTVTVGTTTLTEGEEGSWVAATSNDATATSLASKITALAGVSATADGAVVTVVASTAGTAGNSIALNTNGGSDLTKSGNFLANGVDAYYPYLVFDFARVYFSEYEEQNGRDDIKAQEITLSFAVNDEEVDIPFSQIRLCNALGDYYIPEL